MKIYHNSRCRKSRETLKLINESENQVEIINYLENSKLQIDFGKVIKEEKKRLEQKAMVLDIPYLMKIQNIPVQFLQDITRMDQKY